MCLELGAQREQEEVEKQNMVCEGDDSIVGYVPLLSFPPSLLSFLLLH